MRDYIVVVAVIAIVAIATLYLLILGQPLLIKLATPMFRALR